MPWKGEISFARHASFARVLRSKFSSKTCFRQGWRKAEAIAVSSKGVKGPDEKKVGVVMAGQTRGLTYLVVRVSHKGEVLVNGIPAQTTRSAFWLAGNTYQIKASLSDDGSVITFVCCEFSKETETQYQAKCLPGRENTYVLLHLPRHEENADDGGARELENWPEAISVHQLNSLEICADDSLAWAIAMMHELGCAPGIISGTLPSLEDSQLPDATEIFGHGEGFCFLKECHEDNRKRQIILRLHHQFDLSHRPHLEAFARMLVDQLAEFGFPVGECADLLLLLLCGSPDEARRWFADYLEPVAPETVSMLADELGCLRVSLKSEPNLGPWSISLPRVLTQLGAAFRLREVLEIVVSRFGIAILSDVSKGSAYEAVISLLIKAQEVRDLRESTGEVKSQELNDKLIELIRCFCVVYAVVAVESKANYPEFRFFAHRAAEGGRAIFSQDHASFTAAGTRDSLYERNIWPSVFACLCRILGQGPLCNQFFRLLYLNAEDRVRGVVVRKSGAVQSMKIADGLIEVSSQYQDAFVCWVLPSGRQRGYIDLSAAAICGAEPITDKSITGGHALSDMTTDEFAVFLQRDGVTCRAVGLIGEPPSQDIFCGGSGICFPDYVKGEIAVLLEAVSADDTVIASAVFALRVGEYANSLAAAQQRFLSAPFVTKALRGQTDRVRIQGGTSQIVCLAPAE